MHRPCDEEEAPIQPNRAPWVPFGPSIDQSAAERGHLRRMVHASTSRGRRSWSEDHQGVTGRNTALIEGQQASPGPDRNRARSSGTREITARLWRVSATRRMTRATPRSRCLPAIPRSSAWMSARCVSASTIASRPSTSMTASALRRSPTMGIGTSERHRMPGSSRARSRPRSARWPLSRTGSPSGCTETFSSRPRTAARRAANSIDSASESPRSARPPARAPRQDADRPHAG